MSGDGLLLGHRVCRLYRQFGGAHFLCGFALSLAAATNIIEPQSQESLSGLLILNPIPSWCPVLHVDVRRVPGAQQLQDRLSSRVIPCFHNLSFVAGRIPQHNAEFYLRRPWQCTWLSLELFLACAAALGNSEHAG